LNKRLRKKKRVGEFAVAAQPVRITFVEEMPEDAFDRWLDELLDRSDATPAAHAFGTGSNAGWRAYYEMPLWKGDVRDAIRPVIDWLLALPEVAQVELGARFDAWYDRGDLGAEVWEAA
jgi:uncharacterized protein YggL (DUF469 family)